MHKIKNNVWIKHYLYGCFATSWNDSFVALQAFVGIAVGSSLNPQAVQVPNWEMIWYVFWTSYATGVIRYFAKNPIPTTLSQSDRDVIP